MKLFNFFNKNKQKATDFPSENNLSDLPNYDYRFGEFNINDIPEQYKNNNLIINLSDNDFNCMDETIVINKSDLQKNGNIIIYLDKEIKIKTVKGHNAKII